MPRAAKKTPKPDPDTLYVAWDSVSVGEIVVPEGTRLLGGHPAVRTCPWFFMPADAPDDEIARRRASEYAEQEQEARAASPPEPGPKVPEPAPRRGDDVVAARSAGHVAIFTMGEARPVAGRGGQALAVAPGDRLPRDHPIVEAEPEAFRPVNPDDVPLGRARLATATVSTEDEDGNRRVIYMGQLADRDDPLVQGNWHVFVVPEE